MRRMPKRSARRRSGRPCGSWRSRVRQRRPQRSCSAPAICWCGSGPRSSTPCAATWPSSASSSPRGRRTLPTLAGLVEDSDAAAGGGPADPAMLIEDAARLDEQIAELDREIVRRAKEDETARRLMTIPGIGPVTATALLALAPPAATFRRGRDFAAWLGPDAAAAFDRRQGALGRNLEDGRANVAPPADHRSKRRRALGGPQRSGTAGRGSRGCWPQAADAGEGGARQQDGPHGLGAAGPRRGLPGSGRGRVSGSRSRGRRRRRKVRRRGMAQQSMRRDRENQVSDKRLERAGLTGPDPRIPYRPAAVNRRIRGRTHVSTRLRARLNPTIFLLRAGRPHMSAFMGWPAPPPPALGSGGNWKQRGASTMAIAVLGIDLDKNSCSVVGLDAERRVVLRRRVLRPTLVKLAAEVADLRRGDGGLLWRPPSGPCAGRTGAHRFG